MRRYSSGQRGQTVNLLASAYGGSNPPRRTHEKKQHLRAVFSCVCEAERCFGYSQCRKRELGQEVLNERSEFRNLTPNIACDQYT
jgi:hypothetical protein